MNNIKYYILILTGGFFSVGLCAALFFGYSAYKASNRIEKDFKQSLGALEQELSRLKSKLLTVQNQTEEYSGPRSFKTNNAATIGQIKGKRAAKEQAAIKRLEKIVESTGLDQLAENQDMDPTVLAELYDEYADRKKIAQRRDEQLKINSALHKTDANQYGEELMTLYEQARLRRGSGTDRQQSEKAFAELLAKYPEAYATGMAIAERALVSGFRRNISEVEKYYDMLRDNENFSNIVTDRGVEAMPNIEYYLARQYLRQGNNDDAIALIDSLEINYPDSLVFTRRPGSGRRWQPVSQVVADLRRGLE
ncbi:MAG: tetratricopeptide repeat protein [Deltaproteobacteria bacterium]|nr:tetratricopeptide repeat protein [Deltaproteobacteria bacterium]